VFSLGAACLDTRALSGVSIVKSTARTRYRNTPVTSWINFFPALLSGGGVVVWLCILDFCPVLFFDVWVWLVLRHNWGGMLESFECVFKVERHHYVHLLARIVPFDGESAVSFPFWFKKALIIFLHCL
jgi:hypothetical protein